MDRTTKSVSCLADLKPFIDAKQSIKVNKVLDQPNLYIEATLGECKAVTGADVTHGQNPVWEVTHLCFLF